MNKKVKAILDWMAQEKLCNEICNFTEVYYSGLIEVLAEQFGLERDKLTEYFEGEFNARESHWAAETEDEYIPSNTLKG